MKKNFEKRKKKGIFLKLIIYFNKIIKHNKNKKKKMNIKQFKIIIFNI